MDESKLRDLENRVAVLEESSHIDRSLGSTDKKVIEDSISDTILDIAWDKYFYYYTFFESLDGWDGSATVSSVVTRLFLRTSTVQNNIAYARKRALYQNVLSYEFESRFRTSFDVAYSLGSGSLTTVKAYVGTGHSITGGTGDIFSDGLASSSHYGFYMDDSTLYGICSNGSNYSTIQLATGCTNFGLRVVEARHYPGTKVSFFMSDETSSIFGDTDIKILKEVGSLSTTLPSGVRTAVAQFAVKNTNGAAQDREMDVGFFEMAQVRPHA